MFSLNYYIERELSTVMAYIMHKKNKFNSIINYFHSNYIITELYYKRRIHYTH